MLVLCNGLQYPESDSTPLESVGIEDDRGSGCLGRLYNGLGRSSRVRSAMLDGKSVTEHENPTLQNWLS